MLNLLNKLQNLLDATRAVERLLEVTVAQPSAALLLATLKSHDGYTFYHSVNVAILSLALTSVDTDSLTLKLPGDVQVERFFGRLEFNRQSGEWQGGRGRRGEAIPEHRHVPEARRRVEGSSLAGHPRSTSGLGPAADGPEFGRTGSRPPLSDLAPRTV